ncbi:MAG: hypothetical protein AMXMBFR84_07840 [Candidatus Hydrogenedentota bacterium]
MSILEYFSSLAQNAVDTWRKLSASARVNIAVTALLAVAFIGAVVYMGSRPQFVTLFDNLSASDFTAVQQYLAEEGIPYETSGGGTAIEVPTNRLSDVRVALQSQGIPKSHGNVSGFEVFDTSNIMMNQSEQKIRFQRALQGELQRMLNEFEYVNRSYVMIRESEDELLLDDQRPSTAAVTLDVNRRPSKSEVEAMVNIIASFGGAHLTPDNITLATTEGFQLHGPNGDGTAYAASDRLDYHREVRDEYVRTAENALMKAGVRSVVTLNLDVNFDRSREITEEALEGQPVSTYTQTRTLTTQDSLPAGPTGSTQNLPADAAPSGGVQTVESTESSLENFETGRKVTETTKEPGEVTLISAAVLVEAGRFEDVLGEDGEPSGEKNYVPGDPVRLDDLKLVAANALNLPLEQVEIRDQVLNPVELQAAAATFEQFEQAAWRDQLMEIGTLLGKIILVAIGFLLVRRFLLRSIRTGEEFSEQEVTIDVPRASPAELRKMEIATEVERVAKEQPEQVAALLRTWMSEPESQ